MYIPIRRSPSMGQQFAYIYIYAHPPLIRPMFSTVSTELDLISWDEHLKLSDFLLRCLAHQLQHAAIAFDLNKKSLHIL